LLRRLLRQRRTSARARRLFSMVYAPRPTGVNHRRGLPGVNGKHVWHAGLGPQGGCLEYDLQIVLRPIVRRFGRTAQNRRSQAPLPALHTPLDAAWNAQEGPRGRARVRRRRFPALARRIPAGRSPSAIRSGSPRRARARRSIWRDACAHKRLRRIHGRPLYGMLYGPATH
jgi:hypothetical protein